MGIFVSPPRMATQGTLQCRGHFGDADRGTGTFMPPPRTEGTRGPHGARTFSLPTRANALGTLCPPDIPSRGGPSPSTCPRYPAGRVLTAAEPAVLGHQLLVGREPPGLLGAEGEDAGVSACRPNPIRVPAMNNASPSHLPETQPARGRAGTPPAPGSAGGEPQWGHADPRGVGFGYLDGQHDVGLPLEHLHRLAMAYVFELDSVGCKDLVAHPNAVLLRQPPGVHPTGSRAGAGWGWSPAPLPGQLRAPAPKGAEPQPVPLVPPRGLARPYLET